MTKPFTPVAKHCFYYASPLGSCEDEKLSYSAWSDWIPAVIAWSTIYKSSLERSWSFLTMPSVGNREQETWEQESSHPLSHAALTRDEYTTPCPLKRKQTIDAFRNTVEKMDVLAKNTRGAKCAMNDTPTDCSTAVAQFLKAFPSEKDPCFDLAHKSKIGPVKLGDTRSFHTSAQIGGVEEQKSTLKITGNASATDLHSFCMDCSNLYS